MKGKMKAVVMNEIGKLDFEEREIPVPKDNEVLIKLEHVGICSSDLHFFEHGHIGKCRVLAPTVLGHEPVG